MSKDLEINILHKKIREQQQNSDVLIELQKRRIDDLEKQIEKLNALLKRTVRHFEDGTPHELEILVTDIHKAITKQS